MPSGRGVDSSLRSLFSDRAPIIVPGTYGPDPGPGPRDFAQGRLHAEVGASCLGFFWRA